MCNSIIPKYVIGGGLLSLLLFVLHNFLINILSIETYYA